ncbi:MAG: GDSL-type esterase/lipase family protein [Acetatifactor sp.]|nr:GDSL-type esterase/lipase family protein [Acetatifactor sp.]
MKFTATESNVRVTGRTLFLKNTRYLGYSGSSVSFRFVGKKASALIASDADFFGEELKGRIAVYIDDAKEPAQRICLDKPEAVYTLYEGTEEREVMVTIVKYSEAPFGLCGICEIEIDTDRLLPAPAHKERKLEIIGDSITCGYGVEAESEAIPFHTQTENPTKSYSLLTAGLLDAEAQLVSWSGNGIISHYVEETATERRIEVGLMPKIYQYTDFSASSRLTPGDENTFEKWDFTRFVPQLIIVNLGTNDCSWCKDIQERKDHYRDEYVKFLGYIRKNNPQAQILCMLGTMDTRVLTELEQAVDIFAKENADEKVHFLSLPPQKAEDGYGADWHPSPYTQRMTADIVAAEVRKIMNW